MPSANSQNAASKQGVYVHWPFCLSKCPYCDFNSHVRDGIDQTRWAKALCAEIAHFAAQTGPRSVDSVFFGGGTPSLMDGATVAAVLGAIDEAWGLRDETEITLEANPTSVEAARFADYAAAGINRFSLGIQALNDADLKALGRHHSVEEALAALAVAKRHADRVSFDLIYGRGGQTVDAWRRELGEALALAAGHLSLYQLTIEPDTTFHGMWQAGRIVLPDEDTAVGLYDATQDLCAAAGLPAYEVSNHAAPGQECRHNLIYWQSQGYVGIGPGAHGRLVHGDGVAATQQWRKPEQWLAAVEADGHGTERSEPVPVADRAAEIMMMGLRLTAGIDLMDLERLTGLPAEDVIDQDQSRRFRDMGLLEIEGTMMRLTPAGRRVMDGVLAGLLA